jgi:hypothetical protein
VDLGAFHCGTLNIEVGAARFYLVDPDITLRAVAWTDRIPPEDFSFCACLLEAAGGVHQSVIYRPHPETKVEHFQSESMVEIMAPFIPDLPAGSTVILRVCASQVKVSPPRDKA